MATSKRYGQHRVHDPSIICLRGAIFFMLWVGVRCVIDEVGDPFIVFDGSFAEIIGPHPQLVLVAEKANAVGEGPIYDSKSDSFMYTGMKRTRWKALTSFAYGNRPTAGLLDEVLQVPAARLRHHSCSVRSRLCIASDLTTKTVRHPSGHANGQTLTREGTVLSCETLNRRISSSNPSEMNETSLMIDSFRGKPLNSPNDIVEKKDGTIWFTDPEYGCEKDQFPSATCPSLPNNVYRVDVERKNITPVAGESVGHSLDRPNGLAFSVDESLLYIIDSGAIHNLVEGYVASRPHNITVWHVDNSPPYLSSPKLFANIESDPVGIPDGLRVDEEGNLYVAAGDGVQVFNPAGLLIGKIYLGRQASNLTFGGKKNNILFIAAGPYAYAVSLTVSGAVVQRSLND